jgi:hypothetical protein
MGKTASKAARFRVVETPAKYVTGGKLFVLEVLEEEGFEAMLDLDVGEIVELQRTEPCEEQEH